MTQPRRLCWMIGLGLLLAGCGQQKVETTKKAGNGAKSVKKADEDEPIGDFVPGVQSEPFGETKDGAEITRFLITNKHGMKVSLIDYGATLMSVDVPDKKGQFDNVTLGYPTLEGYFGSTEYFGGIVGRYANRIAKGKFTLNGQEYSLATNDGPNHIHGGKQGFSMKPWVAKAVRPAAPPDAKSDSWGVEMSYSSADGEEGFPGNVKASVVYTLTNNNELRIEYTATTDKPTPINLTNHAYWNLAGAGARDVLDHVMLLNCSRYLPVDDNLLATGEIKDVKGTPFDFTTPTKIGARIGEVKGGYDHCYVVNDTSGTPVLAAKVHDPQSGRVMEVWTTEPGVQFYTGNFLDGSAKSGGFAKQTAFCLECQHFPDSPNKPDFPSTILEPNKVYKQTTLHKFSVE